MHVGQSDSQVASADVHANDMPGACVDVQGVLDFACIHLLQLTPLRFSGSGDGCRDLGHVERWVTHHTKLTVFSKFASIGIVYETIRLAELEGCSKPRMAGSSAV